MPDIDARARLQAADSAHHLHPFCHPRDLSAAGTRILVRGRGVEVEDAAGQTLLDAMAGLWCVNVGYGRNELADAAAAQIRELPYYNTFFGSATPPVIELAQTLARLAPGTLERAFFSNSGSEASDTAIKLARYYWYLCGEPQRQVVIAREYGYHGSTLGGASLSHLSGMHECFGLPIPGIAHIPAPYWYRHGGDASPEAFNLECARALEEKILELGPDRVAAFIAEPIQGSGGLIVPDAGYWKEIRRICDRYEVLLIADEVITAFGRVGHWFGSELYGLEPDMVNLAKGLSSGYAPIACTMLAERVASVVVDEGGYFNHGYTYSGHPVACAVALRNLRIIEDEGLVERVRDDIGPYFQSRVRELADHPLVGDVRGVGLMAGLELVADKANRRSFPEDLGVGLRVHHMGFENGLIVRAIRDVIVLAPPLVISHAEVDTIIDRLAWCLDTVGRGLRAA